jgi:Carboxypeptidase regulatory-like domain
MFVLTDVMRLRLILLLGFLPLIANAAELTGRVTDTAGQPVPGAYVYIYTAMPITGINTICPSCYLDCGKNVRVNADGTYKISGLDPTLKFRPVVVAEGYAPAVPNGYVNPAKHPANFTLEKRTTAECERLVTGRIVDPRGKPVAGAVVERKGVRQGTRIGFGNIPNTEPLAVTDAHGEFSLLVDHPSTKLDVIVRAPRYAPEIARELVPGAPPRTITVDIGASVGGLLTQNGKPAAGVYLKVLHMDRRSQNFLGGEDIATDDRGVFVVTGLGPNEEYGIAKAGAYGMITTVKVGGDGATIDLGTLELK